MNPVTDARANPPIEQSDGRAPADGSAHGSFPARLLAPEEVEDARRMAQRLIDGLGQSILGQRDLLARVVICLLARGHLLLEGLPGLGKTELVKALAALLGVSFRRVQFTPDLLPSDIVGAPILEERQGSRQLVFHRGPIFANLILADEINRATPKTQSALLEAMQEERVTVLGESHPLPLPFFVMATQNPIELEGTYPLPEAQLDRFLFKVNVDTVATSTLQEIITTRKHGRPPQLSVAVSAPELGRLFELVDRIYLPAAVANYAARIVSATHPAAAEAPDEVRRFVRFGASPRAAIALVEAGRASALLAGRPNVAFDDIRRVAISVLQHRLLLDYAARLEGWTTTRLIDGLLASVPEVARPLPADLKQ
jgi:MoxR-like ATPase